MTTQNDSKKIGIGSLSIVLFLVSLSLYIGLLREIEYQQLGAYIVEQINSPFYFTTVSYILLIIAYYIGKKNKNHLFATIGKNLSLGFLTILTIIIFLGILQMVGIIS